MEIEAIYENIPKKVNVNTSGPQTQSQNQSEALTRKRSRWFVMITVLLGLICVLLLVAIMVQHIKLSTERDLMKMGYMNIFEEYNETLSTLKMNFSQLTYEREELLKRFNSMSQKKLELETDNKRLKGRKEELQKNFNSLSQKKLELETDNKHLTDEKEELKKNFSSMSEKKLQLESKVKNLNDALMKKSGSYMYFISTEMKSWSDSRQFCRDRGQDLVIINTEEEQRYISSIAKGRVWIGLSDIEKEGSMTWVDNTPLNKSFWDKGEPNNDRDNGDCVEILSFLKPILNNWNDLPCAQKRKWICENL
ncbi:uncharacterized protein [Paramisgurnus dabryanus]|uniref:uncharacterized protein n=1 Tax=Paramisgurnus dabryanus TaxID=90735 RepID=UPI0031F3D240